MALAYRLDAISQGSKKSRFPEPNPLPLALVMETARINLKSIMHGAVLIIGAYIVISRSLITINVPVIYMARYVMVLRQAVYAFILSTSSWCAHFIGYLIGLKDFFVIRRRQIIVIIWSADCFSVRSSLPERSSVTLIMSSCGMKLCMGPSFRMFSRASLFIPLFFLRPRRVTRQNTISTMKGPMVIGAAAGDWLQQIAREIQNITGNDDI